MTLAEFDRLLAETALRLRVRRAANAAFWPVAATLGALCSAVLAMKLAPAGGAPAPWLSAGLAALLVAGAGLAAYLLRPVSRLAAAAELDRVAGLKERAASLVAVRSGAVRVTGAGAELERDAAAALAPLSREQALRAIGPLPGRARWLAALLAAACGTLLLPARAKPAGADLASLLAGGPEVVAALQGGDDPASAPAAAKAAGKVLTIVKGPPPADPAGAERQRRSLEELAAELRKSGSAADAALARRIDELARELGRLAGPGLPDGPAEPGGRDAARTERAAAMRSYPEYAELLARYFGPEAG